MERRTKTFSRIWQAKGSYISHTQTIEEISRLILKIASRIQRMKAKWVHIVEELRGSMDGRHYARRIPRNGEYGAICSKPELSKKTRKAKRRRNKQADKQRQDKDK